MIDALRRAVAFRRFRAADVRSILAAGAGTHNPPPATHSCSICPPSRPARWRPTRSTPPTGRPHDHRCQAGGTVLGGTAGC
ncbi:transposase domain protein [Mycobacterium avium MAV_120809_2495]|nr:transposase domain protein [Mycobacterium avium MAV_120809_2495]